MTALLLLHGHTPARYHTCFDIGPWRVGRSPHSILPLFPATVNPKSAILPTWKSLRGGGRVGSSSRCTNMEAGQPGLLLLLLLLAGATAQVPFLACVRAQKGPVTG